MDTQRRPTHGALATAGPSFCWPQCAQATCGISNFEGHLQLPEAAPVVLVVLAM